MGRCLPFSLTYTLHACMWCPRQTRHYHFTSLALSRLGLDGCPGKNYLSARMNSGSLHMLRGHHFTLRLSVVIQRQQRRSSKQRRKLKPSESAQLSGGPGAGQWGSWDWNPWVLFPNLSLISPPLS